MTAPPEDGKANDAVVALLSQAWRLPKSTFEIVRGGTGEQCVHAVLEKVRRRPDSRGHNAAPQHHGLHDGVGHAFR